MNDVRRRASVLLRLPESIRTQATEMARADGVSLNQFISIALVERLSRLEVERAARAAKPAVTPASSPTTPRPPNGNWRSNR